MKDEMTKDFDFIAKYAKRMRDEKEKIFSDKIVWTENCLYGTNGQTFLYTETEKKNPECVSVWIIKGKKYEKCPADSETVKEFKEKELEKYILGKFVNFEGSFYVDWQKSVPLPLKLCSKKRQADRISFDLVTDTIQMTFSSGEVDEVKAEYGDFIKDKTEESAGFSFPFPLWIFMNFLENAKDRIKVQYGKSGSLSYAKMTEGKWSLIFATYQN